MSHPFRPATALLRFAGVAAVAFAAAAGAAQTPAPRFDAIAFFTGRTEGTGRFKAVLHAHEPVRVDGRGHMEGDTLVLDQFVTRGDTAPKARQWRIREVSPGRYTGTLTDARGPITGETVGDRLHLRFTSTGGFAVDQWLRLAPGGRSAQNRLVARRFGITVAKLDETIRKLD